MNIPPGFCEVTWMWRQTAGYRQSMSSYGFGIAGWDEDVEAIYDLWSTFTSSMGFPLVMIASGVQVKVGTSNPSAPITFEFTGSDAGSGTNPVDVPTVSLLATKRTNLGGRQGRGRCFLPSPQEGQVNNVGQVDSTFRGNVETAFVSLVEDTATLLGDPSAPLGYLLHADNTDPTEITSVAVAGVVASQRRRLVRTT